MRMFALTAAFTVLMTGACSSADNTANTTPAGNTAAANAANAAPMNPAVGPVDTLKALNAASKKQDAAEIKKYLSSGTMALLEESAANQKKTVDQLLEEDDGAPFKELPETRNEQISGDRASVEVKNTETGEFERLPLVKEDGMWKVALDVYLKEFEQQLADEMGEAETGPAKPAANAPANK